MVIIFMVKIILIIMVMHGGDEVGFDLTDGEW